MVKYGMIATLFLIEHIVNVCRERTTPLQEETDETAETAPPFDVARLFHSGSLTEQIELQLGMLTQGVTECMILATGAVPGLTEGPVPDAAAQNVWPRPKKSASGNNWTVPRSLQLRDAARLSQASASLVSSFVKLRGQFGQRFTVRHTHAGDGDRKKKRRGVTTVTHSFTMPREDAIPATIPVLDKDESAATRRRDAAEQNP